MSREGRIWGGRLWKRFRADRDRWGWRQQGRYTWARWRGDDDRFWRWALRDVSFDVAPGEAVGLVGPNGSGKSTLLKVLTRVMRPYAGALSVAGRVGALIEVRAGIHGELTGRENVYLYGSLLGLQRAEVARRFDRIVEFADLEDAVDRQVKFYSSGMQMRLGFSVAAHLDPDVLLVDEVLAVGDAMFQQRCHDRMREVLGQGTTLVLVSHDLAAIEATCDRGLLLLDGRLADDGPVRDVLGTYREWIESMATNAVGPDASGPVRLLKVMADDGDRGSPRTGESLEVRMVLDSDEPSRASVLIGISEGPATPVFVVRRNLRLPEGEVALDCSIASLPLPRGRFHVYVGIWDHCREELFPWQPVASFDVWGEKLVRPPNGIVRLAPVQVGAEWTEVAS